VKNWRRATSFHNASRRCAGTRRDTDRGGDTSMMSPDARHVFAARCPHGHRPAQSRTLQELRNPAVQFYCEHCHETWVPATPERIRALQFAEASETFEAPNSAA